MGISVESDERKSKDLKTATLHLKEEALHRYKLQHQESYNNHEKNIENDWKKSSEKGGISEGEETGGATGTPDSVPQNNEPQQDTAIAAHPSGDAEIPATDPHTHGELSHSTPGGVKAPKSPIGGDTSQATEQGDPPGGNTDQGTINDPSSESTSVEQTPADKTQGEYNTNKTGLSEGQIYIPC